jgi:hypothetical protein
MSYLEPRSLKLAMAHINQRREDRPGAVTQYSWKLRAKMPNPDFREKRGYGTLQLS